MIDLLLAALEENGSIVQTEGVLLNKLLQGYHRTARPIKRQGDNVTVQIGISLLSLENLVCHSLHPIDLSTEPHQ